MQSSLKGWESIPLAPYLACGIDDQFKSVMVYGSSMSCMQGGYADLQFRHLTVFYGDVRSHEGDTSSQSQRRREWDGLMIQTNGRFTSRRLTQRSAIKGPLL